MTQDYLERFSAALLAHGLVYGPSKTNKDWSVTAADGCTGNFMLADLEDNAKYYSSPEVAAARFAEFFSTTRKQCGFAAIKGRNNGVGRRHK